MKHIQRALTLVLSLSLLAACAPISAYAREDNIFMIPNGVRAIGAQAFSGVGAASAVFLPESVTQIDETAFSNPEDMDLYGYEGSYAQAYAQAVGARFTNVDILGASVSAPDAYVSPNRPITITASAENAPGALTYRISIEKDGEAVFSGGESAENAISYVFSEGGAYTLRAEIQNQWALARAESVLTVLEPLLFIRDAWQIGVGETVRLVDDEETRDVVLTSSDPAKLSVDADSVTGVELGAFTVEACAQTEHGPVYATIPVEVVVPVEDVRVQCDSNTIPEGTTLRLTAEVAPENATYPQVNWTSLQEDIATVDSTGLVTGVSQGAATICARAGDVVAETRIQVVRLVSSLAIMDGQAPEPLYTGMSFALVASATPGEADDTGVLWQSETEAVACVDEATGIVTCVGAGDARILARARDGGGASAAFTLHVLRGVDEILLTPPAGALSVAQKARLEAQILPEDALGRALTWTCDNEAVALVDADTGEITCIAAGVFTVTATAENGVSASARLQVGVKETKLETALNTVYLNQNLTANPYDFVFIYPENATFRELTWESANPACVEADAQTGLLTAVAKQGSSVITGTSKSGLTVRFTVKVVSDESVIRAQALTPGHLVMSRGAKAELTPACLPKTGKYANGAWYSDNTSVVTVSGGKLTAVGAGTANVYAISSSGLAAVCTVLVKPTVIQGLTMNTTAVTLNRGDAFTLTAAYSPANADELCVEWLSNAPEVASVDENGRVRALKGGTATVFATTLDGIRTQCAVTVRAVPMTSAALTTDKIAGNAGETYALGYTFQPENATPAAFTWTSDDTQVARVDAQTGLVRFVHAGTTTVRAAAADGSGLLLECEVTVEETPVTAFRLDTASVSLSWGETHQLIGVVEPMGASYAKPMYASSNPDVATVSEDGLITAVSKGGASITARVGTGEYARVLHVSVSVTSDSTVTYRALVVGQWTDAAQTGFLPFSVNGTKGVNDALRRSVLGGSRYSVNLMSYSPTGAQFASAIASLASAADSNDVTVVFFLTHGNADATEGYRMNMSTSNNVYPSALIRSLKTVSGHVVLILCTCHSGLILSTSAVNDLMKTGGIYAGTNGEGRLSILCSASETSSTFYNTPDTSVSRDFFTYAVTRGLGWDMIEDSPLGTVPADANGDGRVTISELASYSRVNTQRAISAFIQLNGTSQFSGNPLQYPSWRFARGEADLVIFGK